MDQAKEKEHLYASHQQEWYELVVKIRFLLVTLVFTVCLALIWQDYQSNTGILEQTRDVCFPDEHDGLIAALSSENAHQRGVALSMLLTSWHTLSAADKEAIIAAITRQNPSQTSQSVVLIARQWNHFTPSERRIATNALLQPELFQALQLDNHASSHNLQIMPLLAKQLLQGATDIHASQIIIQYNLLGPDRNHPTMVRLIMLDDLQTYKQETIEPVSLQPLLSQTITQAQALHIHEQHSSLDILSITIQIE